MPRTRRTLSTEDFLVQPSSIPGIGLGLFSRCCVHKGDTIGFYTGTVITDRQANREPWINSHYLFWICRDHWILGEGDAASYTRYINHSDRPNTRFVVSTRWKTVRIEAIKRITTGAEVFINYGPEFWEACGVVKK